MSFLTNFFHTFIHYADELWLTLAVGFLLSGLFYNFIPGNIVERYLGDKGLKPIFYSAITGVILPVCCIGSLPIAITLRRKGASLGSVLAFLVATPATSASALLVCWKLLGSVFTWVIFFSTILMAVCMGILTNRIRLDKELSPGDTKCCHDDKDKKESTSFTQKIKASLSYAFIQLPREIGFEVIIGIALASFITVFEPLQIFIREYLVGLIGYAFILIVGLLTYVCSTASVPLADAFLQTGLTQGQALCYLLVGPITSYGTILVIKKDFGAKVLALYLSVICLSSLLFGILFDLILS